MDGAYEDKDLETERLKVKQKEQESKVLSQEAVDPKDKENSFPHCSHPLPVHSHPS